MSEHVFTHYRTGTFTTKEADAPTYRWVRDHHAIHLFLPEAAGPPEEVLAALPASIRPSQVASLQAQLEATPRVVHYLSIPGQLEDASGVMQRVPEGEALQEEPPADEPPADEPPSDDSRRCPLVTRSPTSGQNKNPRRASSARCRRSCASSRRRGSTQAVGQTVTNPETGARDRPQPGGTLQAEDHAASGVPYSRRDRLMS